MNKDAGNDTIKNDIFTNLYAGSQAVGLNSNKTTGIISFWQGLIYTVKKLIVE